MATTARQRIRTTKMNTTKVTTTSTKITSISMEVPVITMKRKPLPRITSVLRLPATVVTTMPTRITPTNKMGDTTRAIKVIKMNTTTINTTTKVHQLLVSNLNTGKG